MARRWKLGATAAVAVLVLAGCNGVARITSSTYQDGVRCFSQSISGDGDWVVFSTMTDPTGRTQDQQTVLRNLDTGASTLLAGDPSGSPMHTAVDDHGTRVVFSLGSPTASGGRETSVQLWTKTSGKRTRISPLGESTLSPAISGDGRKVSYTSQRGKGMWIYDVGTKTRKAIARPAGIPSDLDAYAGDLSGDGHYVVVQGNDHLWVVDTTNGTTKGIPTFGYTLSSQRASISDDGRWVVLGLAKATSQTRSNAYLFDRTTGAISAFTDEAVGVFAGQASISGDGRKIAYTTYDRASGRSALWMRDRASGATTRAISDGYVIHDPTLSDAGRLGVFCSQSNTLVKGSPLAPNLYTWGA